MSPRACLLLLILSLSAGAQTLPPRPLEFPKPESSKPGAPVPKPSAADPAAQLANLRAQADSGDADAAFQLGVIYLIGQGVSQDETTARQYLDKSRLTPARRCFLAEACMESALPARQQTATRWATSTTSGCSYWIQARWYAGNSLGPDPQKEAALLRQGLTLHNNEYRAISEARLGELLLTGIVLDPTPAEKAAWIGAAARSRLAVAQSSIAALYLDHPADAPTPETSFEWTRKAARYGLPAALAALGQAAMTRQASDLSYTDGMAMLALAMRQDLLGSVTLETQLTQLPPESLEELNNAIAKWQRIAQDSGAYYPKDDPLRLPEPVNDAELLAKTAAKDPDAQLRLAYFEQTRHNFPKAEALYREVAQSGPANLYLTLAKQAAATAKWPWASELYTQAANRGSRPACAALAHIDNQGLAGKKDPLGAYLWLLRSEPTNALELNKLKKEISAEDLATVQLTQAQWVVDHKEFWPHDLKAAQAILDAHPETRYNANHSVITRFGPPGPPPVSTEDLKRQADSGDDDAAHEAAYEYAIRLLYNPGDTTPTLQQVEHYATLGARSPEQKARIASGYQDSPYFDTATSRKYAEKWDLAVGGSQGVYQLAKVLNGKSDGTVNTPDEKRAVQLWQQAVAAGDERWARLARMELGYRVIKGWSCGKPSSDAAWAHELAMEFLSKELYQVAGEYSYGRELPHSQPTWLYLALRAAIYNSDNAQGQIAEAILKGQWTHQQNQQDLIDAYAWMKLRAVKQDTGDTKQLELLEQDPVIAAKIKARYAQLLQTRAESGAYFPQDDPLRIATTAVLEPRAAQLDPEAQLRLGTLLEQQATPASLQRAISLYHQIWATAGPEVRLTWGRTLMHGTSEIPRDDIGAQKWLWDAANAGSHEACRDLAVLYAEGRGLPADPVAAEVWTELANPAASPANTALTPTQLQTVAAKRQEWLLNHSDWLSKPPIW